MPRTSQEVIDDILRLAGPSDSQLGLWRRPVGEICDELQAKLNGRVVNNDALVAELLEARFAECTLLGGTNITVVPGHLKNYPHGKLLTHSTLGKFPTQGYAVQVIATGSGIEVYYSNKSETE